MASQSAKNKSQNKQSLKTRMSALKNNRMALGVTGAVLVVIACGGTVAAANASKPGDLLYGVDTAAEKVRLAFSFTNSMKEAAHRSMAKERLQEIQALFKEKDINAPGIAVALANFEQQKQAATDLAKKTSNTAEVEDELASYQSQIDKLFETQQAALENERESLKQQAEAAAQAGNDSLATQLRSRADALDTQLKTLEAKREASKQQQEKYAETLKAEDSSQSSDNKTSESQKEAADKQKEALTEAVKQEVEAQSEAAKQLQEQQQEAAKKAQEKQQEDAKKAQEQQQQQEDTHNSTDQQDN